MKIFFLALVAIIPVYAIAIESERENLKKGWYWYEVTQEESEEDAVEKQLKERAPIPPPPSEEVMMDMHPEEIRELLNAQHEQAIWRPTEDNVKNYLMVQDVMRKKAVALSAAQSYVVMTTPELNSNKEYPLNKVGMNDYLADRRSEVGEQLSKYREKYGLIFFVEKTCTFCVTQNSILQNFADRYGWNVAVIDIKENPRMALRFNVEYTPQIIVVKRNSKKWMPVALGVEPITRLEDNTYRAIRMFEKNSRPDQFFSMDFDERNQTPISQRKH